MRSETSGRAKGQNLARSRFSVRIQNVKAWHIDPFHAEISVQPGGVRKVTTGIYVQATSLLDPLILDLPIIGKQNSPSVLLFTH